MSRSELSLAHVHPSTFLRMHLIKLSVTTTHIKMGVTPRGAGLRHCRIPVLSPWPWIRMAPVQGGLHTPQTRTKLRLTTLTQNMTSLKGGGKKHLEFWFQKKTLQPAPTPTGPPSDGEHALCQGRFQA